MNAPIYACQRCGRTEYVHPDSRGFPPDIAKRKLQKQCRANGCPCPNPVYRAGVDPSLEAIRRLAAGAVSGGQP
jgi:hypothetical protein